MRISPTTRIASCVKCCTVTDWQIPGLICLLSNHEIRRAWGNEKGSNETVLVSMKGIHQQQPESWEGPGGGLLGVNEATFKDNVITPCDF